MRVLLALFFLSTSLLVQAKVYDCFTFCHEVELLLMRMDEMNDYVDKFVIVESVETFKGERKPLFFKENKHRFAAYADKVIHIIKPRISKDNGFPWRREFAQRDYILKGLTECEDNDIIIISDVDEIIKGKDIPKIVQALQHGQHPVVGATMRLHTHFLNTPGRSHMRGPVVAKYALVKAKLPQGLRHMREHVPSVASGWHFSWQGGIEQVLYKMGAYSHFHDEESLKKTVEDYANSHRVKVIPVDDSFPKYMIENQDYLESLGYIYRPWLEKTNESSAV